LIKTFRHKGLEAFFLTLSGTMVNHFAVSVSGSWRLTFRFDFGDAYFVDYLDYH
jgi:plasmid maintenance system killer protein